MDHSSRTFRSDSTTTRSPSILIRTKCVLLTNLPLTSLPRTIANIDCQSEWVKQGECSAVCGNGTQTLVCKIHLEPSGSGAPCICKKDETKTEPCNNGGCEPRMYLLFPFLCLRSESAR